jgi:hypothetical protein
MGTAGLNGMGMPGLNGVGTPGRDRAEAGDREATSRR